MPSLALQTPVLLIDYSLNNDRTSDFLKLLYYTTEEELLNGKTKYDINNPKENKKDYLKIRENLEESCYDFITKLENEKLNIQDLPEIKDYIEITKRGEFQKKLLLDSYNKLNEIYLEQVKNTQEAWEISNKGWENYNKLCEEMRQ